MKKLAYNTNADGKVVKSGIANHGVEVKVNTKDIRVTLFMNEDGKYTVTVSRVEVKKSSNGYDVLESEMLRRIIGNGDGTLDYEYVSEEIGK